MLVLGRREYLRDRSRPSNSTGASMTPNPTPRGINAGLSALTCPRALPAWLGTLAHTLAPHQDMWVLSGRNGRMTALSSCFPIPVRQTGL